MTHKDPLQRPTIEKILSHPFFTTTPTQKIDLNTTRFALTQLITVDSSRLRQGSEDSIEDTMTKRDFLTDRSLNDALQSLILPPSYTGLSKSGVLEVPAFYINTKETLKTLKELGLKDRLTEELEFEEQLQLVKNAVKFEPLKNSLAYLDNNTPRFNLKSQKVIIAETFGTGLLEDENTQETEEDSLDQDFRRCYTFPKIRETPFRSQSTLGQVNGGFQTQFDVEDKFEGMFTKRKLPEVKGKLRKTLTNKSRLLETLKSEVVSTREF